MVDSQLRIRRLREVQSMIPPHVHMIVLTATATVSTRNKVAFGLGWPNTVRVAFGLGVNSPDISQVIHWGPPSDIEDYMQQT